MEMNAAEKTEEIVEETAPKKREIKNVYFAGQVEDLNALETPSFIVAKNGFYIVRENVLFRTCVKMSGEIYELDEQRESISWKMEKLPFKLIQDSLDFFRAVYDKYSAEAAVLITHDFETDTWGLEVPEQEVSGASVDYKTEIMEGRRDIVGTIHSHCMMSAFHSGTDTSDECNFDGIHITLGKVMNKDFDICSSIVANKTRFPIEPEQVIADLEEYHSEQSEHPWLEKVSKKTYNISTYKPNAGINRGAFWGQNDYDNYDPYEWTHKQRENTKNNNYNDPRFANAYDTNEDVDRFEILNQLLKEMVAYNELDPESAREIRDLAYLIDPTETDDLPPFEENDCHFNGRAYSDEEIEEAAQNGDTQKAIEMMELNGDFPEYSDEELDDFENRSIVAARQSSVFKNK